MNFLPGHAEQLTWDKARSLVSEVNQELAQLIDEVSPNKKHWFVKARYPYGSLVMKRSKLMLPNPKGQIVPIDDASIPKTIQNGLSYNLLSNPVSVVLDNSFEIFLPLEDRTIPMSNVIKPGTAFGAWRVLNPSKTEHPAFIWDMSSGARSVFMLPKITEEKRHAKLRKAYGFSIPAPTSLTQHWDIFKCIASNPDVEKNWSAEILYFNEEWFTHLKDPKWSRFYQYFYTTGWGSNELWRNQFIWNLIFSMILKDYEAKPSAFIMDTTKNLLYAATNSQPCLAPVINTSAGPFDIIQEAYLNAYGIKNYPPVILQPTSFDMYNKKQTPVYYSFQFPTAVEFKPSSRKRTSVIADMHEVIALMKRYQRELSSDKFNLSGTSLSEIFKNVQYDYFHNGVELHYGMRSSDEIPLEDKNFLITLDGAKYKSFPKSCPFVKGCVRVALRK